MSRFNFDSGFESTCFDYSDFVQVEVGVRATMNLTFWLLRSGSSFASRVKIFLRFVFGF